MFFQPNIKSLIFSRSSLLLASILACGASSVCADTNTLLPTSYTTLSGSSGGQPVATSIAILDLSGSTDSWNKYVEFGPQSSQKYDGYQSFTLPTSIAPGSVTAIQVKVNYRGPAVPTQTWSWKIYDWTTNSYASIGTNASAPDWGNWTLLNFVVGGTLANYVRSNDGRIQIGLSANNVADAVNIDYEAVIVTSSGGNTGSMSSAISNKSSSINAVLSSSKSSAIASSRSNSSLKSSSRSSVSMSNKSSSSTTSAVSSLRSSIKSSVSSSRSSISSGVSSSRASSLSSAISSSSKSSVASSIASSSSSSTAQIGATYYVSPNGSDLNNGSLNAPWKTIQRAANIAAGGDTVYVRTGTYNETVKFTRSGSSGTGQRIIFRNYPGELPAVDATGKSVVDGQSGVFTLESVSYVTIEGFDIKNFTTSSTKNVPIGIYVRGAGSYVEILNNHISYIKNNANSGDANALGLLVAGTEVPTSINNIIISGNELDHLVLGSSESLSINGNVEHWKVINNKVHDNNNIGIDAIGFEETNPNDAYNQARDGLISGNLVYNISSYGNPAYGNDYAADGIYVDGGKRIIIENNIVHNTDFGIELASEHKGKSTSYVTVRNNLVWNNNTAGITIGGYDADRGTTDYCTIVNNTFLFNDTKKTGAGEFQIQYYANNNVVKNNIFYASSQGILISNKNTSSTNPADLDYNIYFSSVGSGSAKFSWLNKTYTGFSNYWAATGKDARSQFVDPKFVSISTPDLKSVTGSPAVNAGVTLQSSDVGVVDFYQNPRVQGSAIDVGAYEQQ
jgi:parallel beta-helix repeat protein